MKAARRRGFGARRKSLLFTVPVIAFFSIALPVLAVWLLHQETVSSIQDLVSAHDLPPGEVSRLVDGELVAFRTRSLVLLLGWAAVFVAGALFLARRLSSRLEYLSEWASRIGGPGCDVAVDEGGPPEIASLARSLNRLSRDITRERTRFLAAERRYRTLLETMSEGFVIVDPDERIVYANRRFGEMLGFPVEELQGKTVQDFLDEENKRRLTRETVARRRGDIGRYELDWIRGDGTTLTSLVCAAALRDGRGDFSGSFAVITDITDRRRLEEQMGRAERLRALGQLAGGIAHDFNNRLTAILGNAQLLLLDAEAEGVRDSLRTIEEAALEGAETVRRIMDFTRTRPDACRQTVPTEKLLREVLDLLRFRWKDEADEGGYTFEILEDFRATMPVLGFPTELREALLNVLNNAFDAMPKGGELRLTTFDHPDGVGIRVADSGHGMPRSVQRRACDPFFTTRGLDATGLGLSATYGIVGRHGGNLSIQSAVDRGTTVTIILPAAPDLLPPEEPAVLAGPPEGSDRARILVVDDEEGIARLIKHTLARSGHTVKTATTGEEAVAILSGGAHFDIVVTDLGLPGIPGSQVAEEVKARQPHARVVVVTGWGFEAEEALEKTSAVDLVVKKPFSVADLRERVESLLADQKTSTK